MIPSSYMGDSLLPLIALICLVAIFALAFRISSERNPPLFSRMAPCPVCDGDGKLWDQAHGSSDLQLVNCPRCEGTGEICPD